MQNLIKINRYNSHSVLQAWSSFQILIDSYKPSWAKAERTYYLLSLQEEKMNPCHAQP
jgi:hypothetical protein